MSFRKLNKNLLQIILSRPTYSGPRWQTGIIYNWSPGWWGGAEPSSGSRFIILCWHRLLISNMQELEMEQKALKLLWPSTSCGLVFQSFEQTAAVNAASHPGTRGFRCVQEVVCPFGNWNGPKETGLWKKGSYVISQERGFACQLLWISCIQTRYVIT